MKRREFLAAGAVAAVSPRARLSALGQNASRQYIELRRYHLLPGAKQRAFIDFIGKAAIPAMNRAGVTKVGAFTIVYGENAPTLLLVLAHQTLDTVVSLRDRMANDTVYSRDGAAILDTPLSDPAFVRVDSTLLRAFESMPALESPSAAGDSKSRIYELRTYESHSNRAALNKLKMFNAGEVPIFRRAGLDPVFFGETIIGPNMPSLTYMLALPNMAARDAAWTSSGTIPSGRLYRVIRSIGTTCPLSPTSFSSRPATRRYEIVVLRPARCRPCREVVRSNRSSPHSPAARDERTRSAAVSRQRNHHRTTSQRPVRTSAIADYPRWGKLVQRVGIAE